MSVFLKINESDNVAVALENLTYGTKIEVAESEIIIKETIPLKHKFALQDFEPGAPLYMYGVLVGEATEKIIQGGLISLKNTKHKTQKVTGKTATWRWNPPNAGELKQRTFLGYHRKDGQVGTANIWLFFPLVFCENRNIQSLKKIFEKIFHPTPPDPLEELLHQLVHQKKAEITNQVVKAPLNNVEVRFLTHQGGCGGTRQDAQSLAALLAGYVHNPNVAGATVLSLGCQNLEIDLFKKALKQNKTDKPVLIFDQQTEGTTDQFLKKVIEATVPEILKANALKRQPALLNKLTVGLECGGSDGFSGITANPALGYISDQLATLGGKAILAEFPELSGVEQELVNRCASKEAGEKFLHLMKTYEKAAIKAGSGFDMNPSPGNIKDGLITDAMKSAGAAKKAGNAPIQAVLDYTEYAHTKGVSLLCTPGNDVESTTALAGSGANIILFTTGLGTPTGNPITPVIKVGSNSALFERMPDIIDFDCGTMITKKESLETIGLGLLEYIIAVASGEITSKATVLNQHDFIPWKRGVSL
jgi:altronate hydrolase